VIVVDASALLEVLLRTPAAEAVETSLFARPRQTLHAPHLLDVEVTHALSRYAAAGDIDRERGRAALAISRTFPFGAIRTRFFCRGYGSCGAISRRTTRSMSPLPKRSMRSC